MSKTPYEQFPRYREALSTIQPQAEMLKRARQLQADGQPDLTTIKSLISALISLKQGLGWGPYRGQSFDGLKVMAPFAKPEVITALITLGFSLETLEDLEKKLTGSAASTEAVKDDEVLQVQDATLTTSSDGWRVVNLTIVVPFIDSHKHGIEYQVCVRRKLVRDVGRFVTGEKYEAHKIDLGVAQGGVVQVVGNTGKNGDAYHSQKYLTLRVDRFVPETFEVVVTARNLVTNKKLKRVIDYPELKKLARVKFSGNGARFASAPNEEAKPKLKQVTGATTEEKAVQPALAIAQN